MLRALRFLLVGLLPAAAGALPAWAWDEEPQVVLETGYRSGFLLRGVELAGHGAWGGVGFSSGGLRLRAEASAAFERDDAHPAILHGEYRWELADGSDLAVVGAHRRLEGTAGVYRRHATELGLKFTRTLPGGSRLTFDLRRDPRLRAQFSELRIEHEYALTKLGAFLEWSVYAGWVDADDVLPDAAGSRRGDAHGYAGAEFRLPYRVGERTQVSASAAVSGTQGASGLWSPRGKEDGLWATLGLSVTLEF